MHPLTNLILSVYGLHHEKVIDDQTCGTRWKGGLCLTDLDFTGAHCPSRQYQGRFTKHGNKPGKRSRQDRVDVEE